MCGFGGWEVVGGFVLGLVSLVLVRHGDRNAVVRLQSSLGCCSAIDRSLPERAVGEITLAQAGLGFRFKPKSLA